MAAIRLLLTLFYLINVTLSDDEDYRDCLWFGGAYDAPLFPIGICSTYQNEYSDTEDGLYTYSNMYQCEQDGGLKMVEWDNENCVGDPYWNYSFPQNLGFHWNCDGNMECPYTKIKLYQLYNDSAHEEHGDHLCTIDVNVYEEYSFVTNVCVDLEVDNLRFLLDCDADQVNFNVYSDDDCTELINSSVIEEGCDDPFNWDAYVQIAECEDADYDPDTNDDDGDGNNNSSNDLAIIFTVIIAAVIIILVLIIGLGITRRNKVRQSANKDLKEPINVSSFERMTDDIDVNENDNNVNVDSPVPDHQQDISGGDSVNEIAIHSPDDEMR